MLKFPALLSLLLVSTATAGSKTIYDNDCFEGVCKGGWGWASENHRLFSTVLFGSEIAIVIGTLWITRKDWYH